MIAPSIVPAFNSMKILALESICFTVVLGIFWAISTGIVPIWAPTVWPANSSMLWIVVLSLRTTVMKPPWSKYTSEKSNAFSRSGVALIPAAIMSISPDWTAGIKASKPMDLNSIFKPNFLAIASDKSTSKPTYLSPSVNSNGCIIFGLSLPQPANKPIAATATRAIAVNFLNLNIETSSNIHIHGLSNSVYIVRNFTIIGNNIV